MKNVLNILCVLILCLSMFSCDNELILTELITDNGQITSDDNLIETTVAAEKTDKSEDAINSITSEPVEETSFIDNVDTLEDDVEIVDISEDVEVTVDNVDDTEIEPSLENMVKIDALNLYVDIYELSIAEYIKEFPDDRDILIERAAETNPLRRLSPPMIDYPALLSYDQTVEYAERVGKRVMTTDEWEFIAKGNGNRGVGNVIVNNPHCDVVWGILIHVDDSKNPPNGYGVYEMMGNYEEWCYWIDVLGEGAPHFTKNRIYPYIAGVNFDECLNLIRNWYRMNPKQFDPALVAARYVVDID